MYKGASIGLSSFGPCEGAGDICHPRARPLLQIHIILYEIHMTQPILLMGKLISSAHQKKGQ